MCMRACSTGANLCKSAVKIHKSLELLVPSTSRDTVFIAFQLLWKADRHSLRSQCGKVGRKTLAGPHIPYCPSEHTACPHLVCSSVPQSSHLADISSGEETQDRERNTKCGGGGPTGTPPSLLLVFVQYPEDMQGVLSVLGDLHKP